MSGTLDAAPKRNSHLAGVLPLKEVNDVRVYRSDKGFLYVSERKKNFLVRKEHLNSVVRMVSVGWFPEDGDDVMEVPTIPLKSELCAIYRKRQRFSIFLDPEFGEEKTLFHGTKVLF